MNLTTWFFWSILIIVIFAIISNSSALGLQKINNQFNLLTCPLPISNGIDYLNGTINYDRDINGAPTQISGGTIVGTYYICKTLNNNQNSITTDIKQYGFNCTFGSFAVAPCGFLGYISDWIGATVQKLLATVTLLGFILTPINFNILGYTIANIGGIPLMMVIGIYAIAYVGIGIYLYKTASPVASVGG